MDDIPIESMVFAIRVKVNSPFSQYFELVVNEKDKLDPSEISGLPELSEGEYWIDLTGYLVPSKDDYKGDSKDDGWNHSVSFDMSTDFFNNLIVYKNGMNPKTKEQYDTLYQVVSETNAPFLFVELWQGTKNISKSVS